MLPTSGYVVADEVCETWVQSPGAAAAAPAPAVISVAESPVASAAVRVSLVVRPAVVMSPP